MVKRFEDYGGMRDESQGRYVLHSDYAALQASHARLLEALKSFAGYVAADHDDTSLLDNDALWAKALEAIAAAQPFTEENTR